MGRIDYINDRNKYAQFKREEKRIESAKKAGVSLLAIGAVGTVGAVIFALVQGGLGMNLLGKAKQVFNYGLMGAGGVAAVGLMVLGGSGVGRAVLAHKIDKELNKQQQEGTGVTYLDA